MRVLLVDDEPPARRKLRRFLEPHPDVTIVGEAGSGSEAIRAIGESQLDVVFLDVQMPDMRGFDVLRQVPGPIPFRVVFITAHEEFALHAFEVNALDYLLKPVDETRFRTMLDRVREALSQRQSTAYATRWLVADKNRSYFVATASVDWIEAARNYVVLHTEGGEHLLRGTLEAFVTTLDPQLFVRVSRSHVVRIDAIREMRALGHGERQVLLRDGSSVTWTRRYRVD